MHCNIGITHRRVIAGLLPERGTVVEWGCGGTTAWLLVNCPGVRVVSIEHQRGWAERVRRDVQAHGVADRWECRLREPTGPVGLHWERDTHWRDGLHFEIGPLHLEAYVGAWTGPCDVALVDGMARGAVLERIAREGWAVRTALHDAQRPEYDGAKAEFECVKEHPPCSTRPDATLWIGRNRLSGGPSGL